MFLACSEKVVGQGRWGLEGSAVLAKSDSSLLIRPGFSFLF